MYCRIVLVCGFFIDTAATAIYTYRPTLSLHYVLPIWQGDHGADKPLPKPPAGALTYLGPVDAKAATGMVRVPPGMQYLYGSGEAAAASLQTYRALDTYLMARSSDRSIGHQRSDERRGGKECVSTCRSRWSPDH